jgi:hypothetical protein
MRKILILVAVSLGAFAFAASAAGAKGIGGTVSLTKDQVATVCGEGKNYCTKSCGLSGEYTCEFGCGSKGCGGTCVTCPSPRRVGVRTIHGIVLGTVKAAHSHARVSAHTR